MNRQKKRQESKEKKAFFGFVLIMKQLFIPHNKHYEV